MTVAPERFGVQREEALNRASEVKEERVKLRRRLHDREVHIVDILAEPPWYVGNLRLFDLLERGPSPKCRTGTTRLQKHRQVRPWIRALNMRAALANVNLFCEVDDLTPRARAWLVAELRRLYGLQMTGEDWQTLERQVFPVRREEAA